MQKTFLVVFLIAGLVSFAYGEEKKALKPRVVSLGGGLNGGAGAITVGYTIPSARFDLILNAGYGLGKNYSLLILQAGGSFSVRNLPVVLTLDFASYSEKVRNLPGISGDIAKGGKIGPGISLGKSFGRWDARLGYSTALGVTANPIYKFY